LALFALGIAFRDTDPELRFPVETTTAPLATEETPSPSETEPTTEATEPPVTLVSTAQISSTGDMLMHMPCIEAGQNSDGSYSFDHFFKYIKDYVTRADYAVANSQGESRILLYFTKSIGEVTYDLVIWVGLNNSLTCIISTDRALEVDTELSDTSENAIANSTVSKALAGKQERLMDGGNIKTVNGQNILGRGNIEIEGGGGGTDVDLYPTEYSDDFNDDFTS
jgi:hypothetical protein